MMKNKQQPRPVSDCREWFGCDVGEVIHKEGNLKQRCQQYVIDRYSEDFKSRNKLTNIIKTTQK